MRNPLRKVPAQNLMRYTQRGASTNTAQDHTRPGMSGWGPLDTREFDHRQCPALAQLYGLNFTAWKQVELEEASSYKKKALLNEGTHYLTFL